MKKRAHNFIDITGMTFGRLTVTSESDRVYRDIHWNCICSCGNKSIVQGNNLKNGHTTSCGCYHIETRGKQSVTHGGSYTTEYHIWASMKQRCLNSANHAYKYYGGRGIGVCERWLSFGLFLEDMGIKPIGMQLERVDNNDGYFKDNCVWATRKQNMRNRRNNHNVIFAGRRYCIAELAEAQNVPAHALRRRIKYWGMSADDAVQSAKKMRRVGKNG